MSEVYDPTYTADHLKVSFERRRSSYDSVFHRGQIRRLVVPTHEFGERLSRPPATNTTTPN
eukprot:1586143-Pyramimonas_sp.AAC.1